MTEQEAMERLEIYKNFDFSKGSKEAMQVAIQALEQQIKIKSLCDSYIIPKNGVWEINGVDIHKAIEKQIPKQVKLYIGQDMQCPECNNRLRNYEGMKICYCKFCGKALKR